MGTEAQLMKPGVVVASFLKVRKPGHYAFRGFFPLTNPSKCDNIHNEDPKELEENLG